MPQNYPSWSLDKLRKERLKIDKAIKTVEKRDKKATLIKMANIAKQNGFELHELISDLNGVSAGNSKSIAKTAKKRGKVSPKFRNPDDHSQEWTGRGRQPLWVKALLGVGHSMDDLKIPAVAD